MTSYMLPKGCSIDVLRGAKLEHATAFSRLREETFLGRDWAGIVESYHVNAEPYTTLRQDHISTRKFDHFAAFRPRTLTLGGLRTSHQIHCFQDI